MTLNEIKDDVAALGFENEIPLNGAFVSAVRRALGTIYTEHGSHAKLRLYQNPPRPTIYVDKIDHTGSENNTVKLCCRSYAFETFGTGYCTVRDDDGERIISFSGTKCRIAGRCTLNAEIVFEGEFCYTVCHLSGFSEIFPTDDEIPLCHVAIEYKLYDLADGLQSPIGCVKDRYGKDIRGAQICSGILRVPYEYTGEINLSYRKKAPEVYIDTPDDHIEIDPECAHLVPLLSAAYIWLDDDPEKAQYYMSLYRDGMSAVKLYGGSCADAGYSDVTGWA